MNPTVGIAVILTVLQAAHCQMIKDLSACLLGQSLRVDCRYENKTSNPLTYEFSITKDNRKHVIHSTISVSENIYRTRANVTMHKNLVCLYLQSFTTSDEGVYMCELKATNDYTGNQIKNITVIKAFLSLPIPCPHRQTGEMRRLQPLDPEHLVAPAASPFPASPSSRGLRVPVKGKAHTHTCTHTHTHAHTEYPSKPTSPARTQPLEIEAEPFGTSETSLSVISI
ncbi:thy-1 membrane glycoprotein isoform X1 [Ciconia boyciana]|uniref:thy-1 membrane glycoprotein isoform X1 n=1 Tax=Ciconia boyciana TaxID=52775 RepID=UPI003BA08802